MSARATATRYAKALIDVAARSGEAAKVEQDLAGFVQLVDAHADLAQVFASPSVPAHAKRGMVTALADRLGATAATKNTLLLMAERDRLTLVKDLLAVFRERLLDQQKVVRAELRSATPLAPEAVRAIEARLSAVTGRSVAVETRVDPSLIGGVLAKVGSTVYDGTVKTQLEKLRKQLVGAGG
jgi:F-type H+-transporting ATPase subunit delta